MFKQNAIENVQEKEEKVQTLIIGL